MTKESNLNNKRIVPVEKAQILKRKLQFQSQILETIIKIKIKLYSPIRKKFNPRHFKGNKNQNSNNQNREALKTPHQLALQKQDKGKTKHQYLTLLHSPTKSPETSKLLHHLAALQSK